MQPQEPRIPAPAYAPTTAERPRARTGAVVLALVGGLVLGAAGTGAVWALATDGGGGTAAADARAACEALDGFDEGTYLEKGAVGEIALNRYAAAGALSASAAAGDAAYKPLAQAIRRSQERHNQVFEFDATVKKDLAQARTLCEDL